LVDTLHAVAATPCTRRVIVLDGAPGPWLPPGFQVLPQRGDGLDERLGHPFDDVATGGLLIGMDTPHVTPARLASSPPALGPPRRVPAPGRGPGRRPRPRSGPGGRLGGYRIGRPGRRRIRGRPHEHEPDRCRATRSTPFARPASRAAA